jgi:hypothetical protein
MTASSAVVLSNLAYLIGAVVLATIGGLIVWLYHRHPKSISANVESFHRGLQALAPEGAQAGSGRAGPAGVRIQPTPTPEPEVALTRTESEAALTRIEPEAALLEIEPEPALLEIGPEPALPEIDFGAGVVVPINGRGRREAPDDDEAASERGIERRAGAETG